MNEYCYEIDKYIVGIDSNGEDGIGLTIATMKDDKLYILGSCYGDNARFIDLLIKENQELKEKINTYENPNDLTLMFMYCNEKARDMIEELKKELKEKDDFINKLQVTKDRLDKYDYERTNQQKEFIEYLEHQIKLQEELNDKLLATGFEEILSKYKETIGDKE